MSAAESFSSTPPEAPDASKSFFQLVMSGRLNSLSEAEAEQVFGKRDEVRAALQPSRREPRMIHRTAEDHDAMVNWRRSPLSDGLSHVES